MGGLSLRGGLEKRAAFLEARSDVVGVFAVDAMRLVEGRFEGVLESDDFFEEAFVPRADLLDLVPDEVFVPFHPQLADDVDSLLGRRDDRAAAEAERGAWSARGAVLVHVDRGEDLS